MMLLLLETSYTKKKNKKEKIKSNKIVGKTEYFIKIYMKKKFYYIKPFRQKYHTSIA